MNVSPMREVEQERTSLPPLSQSRHGDMACQTLYVHKHVRCEMGSESEAAARGIEIHEILGTYINHLVTRRRSTDLEVFDTLMKGASSEAREALERFRDNHALDPEKILATELHIELDQHFRPLATCRHKSVVSLRFQGVVEIAGLPSVPRDLTESRHVLE